MATIAIIAILVMAIQSYAVAQSSFWPMPKFNIENGYRLYYTYAKDLEVKGYDFSTRKTWGTDAYTKLKIPYVDITYIHVVNDLISTDTAMLFTNARRVDVEIKTGSPIRPMIVADWSAMDLYSWAIKVPDGPDDYAGIMNQRESIHGLYGGAGVAIKLPLSKNFSARASGAYRLLNQNGWEASAGIDWKPPRIYKVDVRVGLGAQYENISYDWGRSRGLGLYGEIGLTF